MKTLVIYIRGLKLSSQLSSVNPDEKLEFIGNTFVPCRTVVELLVTNHGTRGRTRNEELTGQASPPLNWCGF